jgi:predicted TIM-barrel fold metal-dependent hydrolase
MFVGGVRDDFLLTDEEKELILAKNAKRLLGLN